MDWLLAFVIGVAIGLCVALFLLSPKYRKGLLDAQRRVDASEMSLDLAETVGKVGSWSLDLATDDLQWADEVFRMHERPVHLGPPTVEEAIEYYHPDDRDTVQRYIDKAISDGEDYEFEMRLAMLDKSFRKVISRGTCRFGGDGKVNGLYGAIIELPH